MAIKNTMDTAYSDFMGLVCRAVRNDTVSTGISRWRLTTAIATDRFGDYRAFAEVPWQAWTIPITGQVTVFTAQLFFAHRCYTIYNHNKFVFAGLLFGMLASLALFTLVGVFVATDPFNYLVGRKLTAKPFFDDDSAIPAVCVNLVTDLAIAGLTLWKLGARGGKSYSPNTDDVLRRLRYLTVEAAVPPAICALLNMSVYLGTFNSPNDGESLDAGFELPNVLGSNRKTRQTESRRTTIVFATTSGPAYAPNASMGIVDERVEGNEGPGLYGRRSRDDEDGLTTPSSSHKELQVDLDQWELVHSPSDMDHTLLIQAGGEAGMPSLSASRHLAELRHAMLLEKQTLNGDE
ncbi:hypothetical protein FRC01_002549 [Tulasnella sp. 417]|nr:hypothetical protein FRC01_002549 [Tulasnella sp. 417]